MLCKVKVLKNYTSRITALILALALLVVGSVFFGCSSPQTDEEQIEASLSAELDSIKNLDDSFVDDLRESIDMSQLSIYGIDGVEFMESYLDGFDYTIDSITVDGDTAMAQITLMCKSYTEYQEALSNAVSEITANPDMIASWSESDINQHIGEIVISSLDNVSLKPTEPITIAYTKLDDSWQAASATSGDIAQALITN